MTITFVNAAVTFSEIMYDPEGADTGREWVEIRNDGDAITLTGYKFFESSTNHTIVAFQGGSILPSGGYAVIADTPAKFLEDFPNYKGLLFDSSFSLSNAGEYLAVKDSALAILDSVTYSPSLGGQDDGTTLSLLGGAWGRGDPTPGVANIVSTKSTTTSSSGTGASQAASPPSMDLNLMLPEELLVVAGADKEFIAQALTSAGISPTNITYEWSFGDGGTRSGKSVTYHYAEPGFYLLIVEASNGALFAKNRTRVRVIDSDLAVSNFYKNDEKISIGIKNNSAFEVDIGTWKVSVGGMRYSVPKNTIAFPKSVTMLNGLELGMNTSTLILATTSLVFPSGKIVASSTYVPIIVPFFHESTPVSDVYGLQMAKIRSTPKIFKQVTVDNKMKLEVGSVIASSSTLIPSVSKRNKDNKIAQFINRLWFMAKDMQSSPVKTNVR